MGEAKNMIVLNLILDGIYGFDDFNINFTYPKKIVNSIIKDENLEGRERFRYKKAVILMGQMQQEKRAWAKHCFGFLTIWLTEIRFRSVRW